MEVLERVDTHAHLRNALRSVADGRGTWSGIPMPLDGEELVIEPSYPKAAELMRIGKMPLPGDEEVEDEALKATVRSRFWSTHKRSMIIVFNKPNGQVDWGLVPGIHHFDMDLRTLGCSDAWGIEQEHNALQLLGTLLRHRAFKQYLLTGSFLEKSARSGIMYLFRKLRPTVAIRTQGERTSIMCALCMHPIAYYNGSWAGAMTPTDDVVAHLMLMRGDEALFWKRCNQHPSWAPQAGL